MPFEDFRAAGIAATRQLAWLRSMSEVDRRDPLAPGAADWVWDRALPHA